MMNLATKRSGAGASQKTYAEVEAFVRERSRTYRFITSLLPPEKRKAAFVAYAFFRRLDDLVDREKISLEGFRAWRQQALLPADRQSDAILSAWADFREQYSINPVFIDAILDGIEMDISKQRYESLSDLEVYCNRTASAAGILYPIIGLAREVTPEQAEPYLIKLCAAAQLADILCDINEDLQVGRIYLPRQELAVVGLSYEALEARIYDERFKELMKRLIQTARDWYLESWPALQCFTGFGRLAIGFGATLSWTYLAEIEAVGFDVFNHQVTRRFPSSRKIRLLVSRWPAIMRAESPR